MKQNRLTKLLAAGAVSAIALTTAFAQQSSSSTTTTTTDGSTSTSSTTTKTVDGSGKIASYKAGGDFITVQTASSTAPIMYYYTKSTTIVDADGKKLEWAALKSGLPVKYTYVTDGDRMVVQKITVEKPETIEKTTTTTTTTQPDK